MTEKIIKKEDIPKLIAAVTKDVILYGPVREKEDLVLKELSPKSEIILEYQNTKLPLKSLIFPQTEKIGAYDGETIQDPDITEKKIVIFGVRPCDTMALTFLDKVFLDEKSIDPFYQKRRNNATIISLACSDPAETCFCNSVKGSPFGKEGADILAYNLKDTLLFESCTDRGVEFINTYKNIFQEPSPDHTKEKQEQISGTTTKMSVIDTTDIDKKIAKYTPSDWEKFSQLCLNCGTCTYLCPTCHCFGIYEDKTDKGKSRVRVYDSCQFPSFTMEASGHNPRSSHGDRMRQRMMHKFCYAQENFNHTFCVGCGRCIQNCPVNLDVRQILHN